MSFVSAKFLVLFPFITLIYFVIPHKVRWVWLLVSSYFIYISWNPKYVILLAITTIITYVSGLMMEKADKIGDTKRSLQLKKLWVFISFAVNVGILFLFKYLNFFDRTLVRFFSWFGITINIPSFDILLPIGISFYTFKALSYVMDVYRKDVKVQRNLGKYALYVSFFPQLAAGPIDKSKHQLDQFDEKHSFDYDRVKNGLLLMIWGYFQKFIIADRLSILVNNVYNNPANYKGFEIILATVFFAFQLYCDFSAYSDIAVGIGEVLGFRFTRNFRQPYFARSIKDFWKRWHISLSSWLMDYLYFPLGGSRCSRLRHYFNIMVVFLVSGLWHGAGMTFVIWGALHGIYQVIGNILKPVRMKVVNALKINPDELGYKLFQAIFTFVLVDFAWLFFRANTFTDARILVKNMLYFNPWIFINGGIYNLGLDSKDFFMAVLGIIIILIANLMQRNKNLRTELSKQSILFRWGVYIAAAISIAIFGIYGPGYDIRQFIYYQF